MAQILGYMAFGGVTGFLAYVSVLAGDAITTYRPVADPIGYLVRVYGRAMPVYAILEVIAVQVARSAGLK